MDLAKKLDAGDEYVALSRSNPEEQFKKLKEENPYGRVASVDDRVRFMRAYSLHQALTLSSRQPDPPRSSRMPSTMSVGAASWSCTAYTRTRPA